MKIGLENVNKNNILSEAFFHEYCLDYIRRQFKDTIGDNNKILNDYIIFEQDFINQLKTEIISLSIKPILKDFHDTFEYFNQFDQSYYVKQYTEVIKARSSQRLNSIIDKIYRLINHKISYLKEILNNITLNKLAIKDKFSLNGLKIVRIYMGQGDSHNDNKNATLITLADDIQFFYKPRQGFNDQIFFNLLKEYITKNKLDFFIPKIVSFSEFSLSEFVKFEELNTRSDASLFYYNFGVLAAYLYSFNITDMHYENFIAKGTSPVPIDLETLFQTNFIPLNMEHSHNKQMFNKSILGTLLFDFISDPFSDLLPNIGGITLQKGEYQEEVIEDKNTDKMRLIKKEFVNSEGSINLCKYKGDVIYIFDEKQHFLQGFESAYNYIKCNRDQIISYIDGFSKIVNTRVILRPTYVYFSYLEAIKQPQTSKLTDKDIFAMLKQSNYHDEIIYEEEKRNLENYDIPFFLAKFDSTSIYSGKGEALIDNFFNNSPRLELEHKLSKMSDDDLNDQKLLIGMCISSYQENVMRLKSDNSKDNIITSNDCNTSSANKEDIMFENILQKENIQRIDFLSPRYDNNALCAVSPMNIGLYEGVGGYFLACQLYEKQSGRIQFTKDEIDHKMNYLFELTPFNNLSIYYGKASYFKFYLELEKIKPKSLNTDIYESFESFCQELYTKELEVNTLDYIGGKSGMLSLAIDYYRLNPTDSIHKLINKLSSSIINDLVEVDDFIYWPSDIPNCKFQLGLAHGITGINYALSKALAHLEENNETQIINIIKRTEEVEDTLYDRQKQCWIDNRNQKNAGITWCNGISGLLLGRLFIRHNLKQTISKKDQLLADYFLDNYETFKLDDSLCHGHAGNLIIIQTILNHQLLQNYKVYEFKKLANKILNELISKHNSDTINTGYAHNITESKSLYLGATGTIIPLLSASIHQPFLMI